MLLHLIYLETFINYTLHGEGATEDSKRSGVARVGKKVRDNNGRL